MAHSNGISSISLITADKKRIVGDYYHGSTSVGALLLHMMPATRESWDEVALKLQDHGMHVLAIDLRGHGESDGGPDGFRAFSDAEHQDSARDVASGVAYLRSQGATTVHIMGASIGANLALQAVAGDADIATAVCISPGIEYRGIRAVPNADKVRDAQAVMLLAARDDDRMGAERPDTIVKHIAEAAHGRAQVEIFDEGGHGTDLLKHWPDYIDTIIDWMTAHS